MKYPAFILPSVHVVDPRSPFHTQAVDLLISDGQVRAVSEPNSLTDAPKL